jgi:hypothetical protein
MLLYRTGHSHSSPADPPASVIVTDIARPVAEVPITATEPFLCECLLVEACDDPMETDDAHAEPVAADLRGEVIRDRMLLYMQPSLDNRCVAYTTQHQ